MTNGTTGQLLTPEQFATHVRANYPGAYDDLSDAGMTQKVLGKFPEYFDMVQPTQGTQGAGTRGPLNTVATMGAAAGGPSTSRAAASTSRR
jgi:hypothetical protein